MGWLLEAAPPEEIDAGPVRLRRWRVVDAGVVTRLVTENLDHLRPWMAWAQEPPGEADERDFLGRMQAAWDRRSDFGFAVERPGTGPGAEPIGGMGLHTRQGAGTLEIGYWIAAASTGRGYATAGALALTDAAFALPGVERVEIRCDEANRASAAIPRRLGYRLVEVVSRQAVAPAESGRGMIWAVERAEWAVRARAVARPPDRTR
ncbi:MAG TPA: GNAT family N-acetyltransferase [Terriglobales bacterium]|nr:GNAT family N-acetyltransferase [Terriglobales bacterium]